MRRLTLIIATMLFILTYLVSQPCIPDGIILSTQAEIDSFAINHPNCTDIEGSVYIKGLGITNLNGLNIITTIGEWMGIEDNDSLVSLSGLNNLEYIGGNFHISGNWQLKNFNGLENLIAIGGFFNIGSYDQTGGNGFTTMDGLDNLTYIEGTLSIINNDYLQHLIGLEQLKFIGDDLLIQHNNNLTSLSGIDNVTYINSEVIINVNPLLSHCAVQSICNQILVSDEMVYFGDNATGCENIWAVEEACETVFENEIVVLNKTKIHPNPFTSSTTIKYELSYPETVTITFYNQFGRQVDIIRQDQSQGLNKVVWTPENLVNGVYYFRLQAGDQVTTGKLVKMR